MAQLLGGTGELAQYQHPVVSRAGGNVLFRYQVHAVPQRRHTHDVGHSVVGDQLLGFEAPVPVVHRNMMQCAVSTVDPTDQALDFVSHGRIVANLLAARNRNLQEQDILSPFPVASQEGVVRPQPYVDPFGVVEAVDPQNDLPINPKFLTKLGHPAPTAGDAESAA